MKLGIYLPNTLAHGLTGGFLLEWARGADRAGFHMLATLDRPNYDSWDGLATLAGVATATERIRLATMMLQLPPRQEVVVAKQAAVIDQLSGGRFELGVSVGARPDDYAAIGGLWEGRFNRFSEQVATIRRVWAEARGSTEKEGVVGPPPAQERHPPIWIGGYAERAIERAVELGEGFCFGGDRFPPAIAEDIASIRERARGKGKEDFRIASMLYVAIGEEQATRDAMWRELGRYYREYLRGEPEDWGVFGPVERVAEITRGYADAGLDLLILAPQLRDLHQLESVAQEVLPQYI